MGGFCLPGEFHLEFANETTPFSSQNANTFLIACFLLDIAYLHFIMFRDIINLKTTFYGLIGSKVIANGWICLTVEFHREFMNGTTPSSSLNANAFLIVSFFEKLQQNVHCFSLFLMLQTTLWRVGIWGKQSDRIIQWKSPISCLTFPVVDPGFPITTSPSVHVADFCKQMELYFSIKGLGKATIKKNQQF